jgi:muconolactone delta-isomerase
MIFYVQMKWNYQGRISQDELWRMEASEGDHAESQTNNQDNTNPIKVLGLYKVVSQHRVIAIVDVNSVDDLDRNSMGGLPMREYLEFETVWALRDYKGFMEDVRKGFK